MATQAGGPGGEGGKPQDPQVVNPQDPQAGEGGKPQDPGGGEGGKPQDPQSANIHKLERDVANRDKRIKELEEQLEEATGGKKTADDRLAEVEKQLKAIAEERDAAKADSKLTAAGCIDCELGRAALASFDGDVDALKEAKPYLFEQKRTAPASTGGKPAGGAPKMTKQQILDVKDGGERRRLIAENRELFGI